MLTNMGKGETTKVEAEDQDLGIDTKCRSKNIARIDHRSPITLWGEVSNQYEDNELYVPYHFQRPDSPNPDLDLAFHSFYIVQINPFPPATTGGFPPKEQEFLSHADGIVVRQITSNVSAKLGEGKTADDRLVRLRGSVSPLILAIEPTAQKISTWCI